MTSLSKWQQRHEGYKGSTVKKQQKPECQLRTHQLAVLIDAPAKDDSLYRRPLHILRQGAAEVAHAAGLLQEAPLR